MVSAWKKGVKITLNLVFVVFSSEILRATQSFFQWRKHIWAFIICANKDLFLIEKNYRLTRKTLRLTRKILFLKRYRRLKHSILFLFGRKFKNVISTILTWKSLTRPTIFITSSQRFYSTKRRFVDQIHVKILPLFCCQCSQCKW